MVVTGNVKFSDWCIESIGCPGDIIALELTTFVLLNVKMGNTNR